jgi:hypothetical protein
MSGYAVSYANTTRPLLFRMVLSTDHASPATGKSPTVRLSKNGSAFSGSDANTPGVLTLYATAADSDPVWVEYEVVRYDPNIGQPNFGDASGYTGNASIYYPNWWFHLQVTNAKGAFADADTAPVFDVRQVGADHTGAETAILSAQTMNKQDDANTTGLYYDALTLSPGTYQPRRTYMIRIAWEVDGAPCFKTLTFTTNPTVDAPVVWYVDGLNGDNANHGLTLADAYQTVSQPLGVGGHGDIIQVAPTAKYRETFNVRFDCTIQSLNYGATAFPSGTDPADLSDMVEQRGSERATGWTPEGSNTYSCAWATVAYQVRQEDARDANGNWLELDNVTGVNAAAGIAACKATANTFYNETIDGILYVHLADGSDPTAHEIEVCTRTRGLTATDSSGVKVGKLVLKGIAFTMNRSDAVLCWNIGGNGFREVFAYNCVFRYSGNNITGVSSVGMGFATVGEITSHFEGCWAIDNAFDGFNYHSGGLHREIRCVSERNEDDGSSAHEGASVYRKHGIYRYNGKGGAVDVLRCATVNEDCIAVGNRWGFATFDKGSRMIADGCYSSENTEAGIRSSDDADAYCRNVHSVDNTGDLDYVTTPLGTATPGRITHMARLPLADVDYTAPNNAGIASILTAVDTEVAAIKAKTDLIPADPATETTLATRASQASVNTIDDFLDTEIAAIKAKTDPLPGSVWSHTARTLTTPAASAASLDAGELAMRRGDTWTATLTGLGSLAGATNLWFTLKADGADADADAMAQIDMDTGLLRLNGSASVVGSGTLTIDDEGDGDITVTLSAPATDLLTPGADYPYDVQLQTASRTTTIATGLLTISGDVTRAAG